MTIYQIESTKVFGQYGLMTTSNESMTDARHKFLQAYKEQAPFWHRHPVYGNDPTYYVLRDEEEVIEREIEIGKAYHTDGSLLGCPQPSGI